MLKIKQGGGEEERDATNQDNLNTSEIYKHHTCKCSERFLQESLNLPISQETFHDHSLISVPTSIHGMLQLSVNSQKCISTANICVNIDHV